MSTARPIPLLQRRFLSTPGQRVVGAEVVFESVADGLIRLRDPDGTNAR